MAKGRRVSRASRPPRPDRRLASLAAARGFVPPLAWLVMLMLGLPAAAQTIGVPEAEKAYPSPHTFYREVMNAEDVRRVTGANRVIYDARPKARAGSGFGTLDDGVILFFGPEDETSLKRALQLRVLLVLAPSETMAREGFGEVTFPISGPGDVLGQPVARPLGDEAKTVRVVLNRGSEFEGEAYQAEGGYRKGRYIAAFSLRPGKSGFSAERMEKLLLDLMTLFDRGVPGAGVRPDAPTLGRPAPPPPPAAEPEPDRGANQPPRIRAIRLDMSNYKDQNVILQHDRAFKVRALVEDPDRDELEYAWTIRDAGGVELYAGEGVRTSRGTQVMVALPDDGSSLTSPFDIYLRVTDEDGEYAHRRIFPLYVKPVARVTGWYGPVTVYRHYRRMRTLQSKELYKGDVLYVERDAAPALLPADEQLTLNQLRERMTFVDVEWPRLGVHGRFLGQPTSPVNWFHIKIGDPPRSSFQQAADFLKDQVHVQVHYDTARDKVVDGVLAFLFGEKRPTANAVAQVMLGADKTMAGSHTFIELRSEVVIQPTGAGELGIYTLQGLPRIVEETGRERFEIPPGRWARVPVGRVAEEAGDFDPASLEPWWERVDEVGMERDPTRLRVMAMADRELMGSPARGRELVLAGPPSELLPPLGEGGGAEAGLDPGPPARGGGVRGGRGSGLAPPSGSAPVEGVDPLPVHWPLLWGQLIAGGLCLALLLTVVIPVRLGRAYAERLRVERAAASSSAPAAPAAAPHPVDPGSANMRTAAAWLVAFITPVVWLLLYDVVTVGLYLLPGSIAFQERLSEITGYSLEVLEVNGATALAVPTTLLTMMLLGFRFRFSVIVPMALAGAVSTLLMAGVLMVIWQLAYGEPSILHPDDVKAYLPYLAGRAVTIPCLTVLLLGLGR